MLPAGSNPSIRLRVAEAAALLAIGAFLLWTTRGFTFLQDEWDFIQFRLNWDATAFLNPHNQHLLATDLVVYKLLFATAGVGDYLPYRVAGVTIHLGCVALLFEVARRRIGTALAAAVALPVAVLGCGWYVVLNPFNMQWSLSLASLLAIVLLLDRTGRRYDVVISLLVLLALASSSFGVPVTVGVAAYTLIEPGRRRSHWVWLVPLALYGAWYLGYGMDASRAPGYELTLSPVYLFHVVAGAVGGLLGIPLGAEEIPMRTVLVGGAHLLTLLLAGLLVLILAKPSVRTRPSRVLPQRSRPSPRLALALSTCFAFWLLLTVSRGYLDSPYATHYAFVGVVLLILVGLELTSGLQLSPRVRIAAAALLGVSTLLNVAALTHYADLRRADSQVVRAQIGALQLARETVPPDFKPNSDPEQAPSVVAGPLLASLDRLGSKPGFDAGEIAAAPRPARAAADAVLAAAGQGEAGGVAGWTEKGRR